MDTESDETKWKQTYTYGAGGERLSMNYLPAYDANNGWEPTPGAGGAEPGVAPRTLYYLNDALGSTLGLIENDGRVSSRYHYDEFGIPLDAKKFDVNWPGPDNLFGYTGLGYDYTSSLTYARARYYKPEIGRFISEDTYKGDITNPLSLNLYTYVKNNPLSYVDPSGHEHKVSDYTFLHHYVPIDDFEAIPVYVTIKKHEFTNINITVYENLETSFHDYANACRTWDSDSFKAYDNEKQAFIDMKSKTERRNISDMIMLDDDNDKTWAWTKVGVSAVSDVWSVLKAAKILRAGKIGEAAEELFMIGADDVGTAIGDRYFGDLPNNLKEVADYLSGLIPIYGTYQAVVDASSNDPIKGFFVDIK